MTQSVVPLPVVSLLTKAVSVMRQAGPDRFSRLARATVTFSLVALLMGCACRPGYVGPYGVRPARCWVW